MSQPMDLLHTITLDASLSVARFQQLADQLRSLVREGFLGAGVRLPASRVLARALGVSRNTVTAAYDQLLDEGFLVSRVGSGTFVCDVFEMPATSSALPPDGGDPPSLSRRATALLSPLPRIKADQHLPFALASDLSLFPLELWGRMAGRHWRDARRSMLSYADSRGYAPLRKAIADYSGACRGVRCDPDRIIVLNGSQQALDLCARLLLDEGDRVVVEEPAYDGGVGILRAAGGHITGLPVDKEGLVIDASLSPKLIYVTPSAQYPTGVTMSLARRMDLLGWARDANTWILEDDYGHEYFYEGRPVAALQGLDRDERVIYVGSFSKVLFPGLRIGYLVLPPSLVAPFQRFRAYMDRQPPLVIQAVLAEFMDRGLLSSHLRKTREIYRLRRDHLLAELADLQVDPCHAGMHLLLRLPTESDDLALARSAAREKLILTPLSAFFHGSVLARGFLLGFAPYDQVALSQAASRLRDFLNREL